ncbi:MAG TPA: class I SAM-dependent methyltransferase family protein [Thermoanaerobaculales bacterium]|nr:class I SAM-dependent methyltransferase family protein [Thermoanaerobaculales bacterium]HQN95736.1 class I SAM-dependent methyltransferase family protein [Thermoanaerobaculales bacterium]
MAKPYESLMGVFARSVFYRPERQRVRELLSRDAKPQLMINGTEFPLFDMSMNGLSFISTGESSAWKVGDEVELSLVLHNESIYQGPARIARTEAGPRGAHIGVGLTTGFLDLPEISRRDDEKRLERELRDGCGAVERLVPGRYREQMAKAAHFLSHYNRVLRRQEQLYRESGRGEEASTELAERAYESLCEPWWDINVQASRAAVECLESRDVLVAAKEYTEALVTPLVMDSAIGFRAYTKPLGYAGDYHVMLWFYANEFEGKTALGKVIHKFYVDRHPMGRGVRTRKDFIVDLMYKEHERFLSTTPSENVFRVVSLGCGPAREVSDFVSRHRTWNGTIAWTLIDQEEEALSVAYRDSRREIGRWGSGARLNLLNLSFVQLLSEGVPLQDPGSQHLIFSAGFFDYLREGRAQTLLKGLFDLLAPGGMLAIGNAVAPNEFFWNMEFLVDWTLYYRSRQEMLGLASLLPDTAEREVLVEPSGGYHFLLVRKH